MPGTHNIFMGFGWAVMGLLITGITFYLLRAVLLLWHMGRLLLEVFKHQLELFSYCFTR